jgi:positive regulator of sigma E activity
MNLIEIVKAWATAVNPDPTQVKIAAERYSVCVTCPSKKEILSDKKWSEVCGECGCPLKAKIYTQKAGTCPLGKWDEVDKKYFK